MRNKLELITKDQWAQVSSSPLPYAAQAAAIRANGLWLATINDNGTWAFVWNKQTGMTWCKDARVDSADVAELANAYCQKLLRGQGPIQAQADAEYYAALTEG